MSALAPDHDTQSLQVQGNTGLAGKQEAGESPCTDLANGQRFAKQWESKAKFVPEWKTWLVWDGTRWAEDHLRSVVEMAKRTSRTIYREAASAKSEKQAEQLADWAKASGSDDRIRRMLNMASSDPRIVAPPGAFDADPYKLNTPSGTIDLRSGERTSHNPADMFTKLTMYPLVEGNPERWLAFLSEAFSGDQELISYVQRLLGYSLLGTVREHVLPVCWGNGANGKSTLFETVQDVLGEYAAPADPNLLMAKRFDAHPTGMADLKGRRMVTCQETAQGRNLDESTVKNLTGGTKLKARRMHADFFEFEPSHTIWLATNHLPVIRNTDQGIWRRVKLIPFTVEIPPDRQDPDLKEKLTHEEGGTILAWLVEGCLAYHQAHGLGEAKAVKDATACYQAESDLIGQFIAECCVLDVNAKAAASELYQDYSDWAKSAHVYVFDKNRFARELAERGFEKKVRNDGNYYLGLGPRASVEFMSELVESPAPVADLPNSHSFDSLTDYLMRDLDRLAA